MRSLVTVAEAALRLGHTVAVAAPEPFHADIEPYGLEALAAGHDWRPEIQARREEQLRMIKEGAGTSEDGMGASMVAQVFAGESARRMAIDLLALAPSWRPDVVVREPLEFGGCLAAEVLGIPHVSVGVNGGVAALNRRLPPAVIEAHRAALGLPPDPHLTALCGALHANLMPAAYDPAELEIPTARCYRHTNPGQVGEELPGWVGDLPDDRPLVFAAMGTFFHIVPGRMEAMIAALAELECTAIIAVGAGKDVAGFGPQPPHLRLVEWIAQPLLLECCDLFVTHGGFNSVRESLRLGVPLVVVPVTGDQPYNAARCAEVGVARALPGTASPAALRDACREVLEDPGFRRRARALQRQILALPPPETLIRDIEALVAVGSS